MRAVLAGLLLATSPLGGAAPAQYRDHVGVYVWGKLRGGLAMAASDVKRLGADHAVRVYIGPGTSWDPSGRPDHSPLDLKAQRDDYRAFLAAFPVVMLTAYDSASFEKYKSGHLDARQLAATRDEFRRFTLELAKLPGRRIISNWEFENDCRAEHWDACREYYQARLDGIREGRREATAHGYPGEILTAFEFLIVPGYAGRPSGLAEVGTKLQGVDIFSYSSWPSISWNGDAARVYKDFEFLARLLQGFFAAHTLSRRLVIGEFGEYWNEHPDGARMKALIDASLNSGVEYLFDWVLYDQPGNRDDHGRDASHFGKYTLSGSLTPQGRAFLGWLEPPAQR
jgi:hypothetical protein